MQRHKISLITAILLNINIMVGSGILLGPGAMAAIAGNASFLTWLIVGILLLPVVLSIVQLSRLFPGAGGFYMYAKQGLGTRAGFMSGWLYMIGYAFIVALEIVLLRQSLVVTFKKSWFVSTPLFFNMVIALGAFFFNLLNFSIITGFLNIFAICELLPLLVLIVLIPFIVNPEFSVTSADIALLPGCIPLALFGYFGFEASTSISDLIVNNKKNAPRALIIGFVFTALIYTLFNFGVLNVMGARNLALYNAPAYAEFLALPYLSKLLRFLIPLVSLIAVGGTVIGLMNTNSFLVYAMAKENLFKTNKIMLLCTLNGRPWAILALQSCLIWLMATLVPTVDGLNGLCNVSVFISFIMALLSLFKICYTAGHYSKIPGVILSLGIIIGLIAYSWYCLAPTLNMRLVYTFVLLLLMLTGLLLYNKESI